VTRKKRAAVLDRIYDFDVKRDVLLPPTHAQGSKVEFIVGEQVLALWKDDADVSGEANTAFYRGVVVEIWDQTLTIHFVNEEGGEQFVCKQDVPKVHVVRDCTQELCMTEGAVVDVLDVGEELAELALEGAAEAAELEDESEDESDGESDDDSDGESDDNSDDVDTATDPDVPNGPDGNEMDTS